MKLSTLDFFDSYVQNFGWEVIPIRPHSKVPYHKEWSSLYDPQEARRFVEKNPDCNIGLRLGHIVDVEGDTAAANQWLAKYTKNHPHPMYRSSKSVHHLFAAPPGNLRRVVIGGVEFRGWSHQSLLPPSMSKDNIRYRWLRSSTFTLSPLPPELLRLLKTRKKFNRSDSVKVYCSSCAAAMVMNKKRHSLECLVFKEKNLSWLCKSCRSFDIREMCRKMRSR